MSNEVSISIIDTLEHTVHSFKLANLYFPSSFHLILDKNKFGQLIDASFWPFFQLKMNYLRNRVTTSTSFDVFLNF